MLSAWLGEHRSTLPAHLALDGKRIREHLGTIVTLCDIQEQVPVAVRATIEKGGEQSASRALLRSEEVHLLESTVSLDALYANPENARLIVQEKGGQYLISLKDNQPTLLAHTTAQLAGTHFASEPEVRGGELIERELSAAPLRSESAAFPHVAQAVCARRAITHKKSGKETRGTRHYITSRSPAQASPPHLAKLVRGHWSVENNIHWLRDAVWNEDACRTHDPNTACALALLRTTLLAPLRSAGHRSPQQAVELFAHKSTSPCASSSTNASLS